MKTLSLAVLASVAAAPVLAQETRELDAHVHGISTIELAIEDATVEVSLMSPGMDIVGFEYVASSTEEKSAVAAATRTLSVPENVLGLPEAAACHLTETGVHMHTGDHDHEHEHEHAEGEDHAHAEGEDHAEGEAHAEGHDHAEDHDHAEGEAHAHAEGEAAKDGAEHSEFHASFGFTCEHPEQLTKITFPFFGQFENAREIEVKYVTAAGAGSAKVSPDAPELSLN